MLAHCTLHAAKPLIGLASSRQLPADRCSARLQQDISHFLKRARDAAKNHSLIDEGD
jgi:hypothetical protein